MANRNEKIKMKNEKFWYRFAPHQIRVVSLGYFLNKLKENFLYLVWGFAIIFLIFFFAGKIFAQSTPNNSSSNSTNSDQQQIQDKQQQIEDLQKKAESYRQMIEMKQNKAQTLENQIELMEGQISSLESDIANLQQDIDKTSGEIEGLVASNRRKRKRY